jgi:hypothetical protein
MEQFMFVHITVLSFLLWFQCFKRFIFYLAVSLIKAAQGHTRYCVVDRFSQAVQQGSFSPAVRLILSQLCELLMIYWLMDRSGDFVLVFFHL